MLLKVVINKRFGGFGLSDLVFKRLIALGFRITKYNKKGNFVDSTAEIVEHHRKDWKFMGRFSFTDLRGMNMRTNSLVVKAVEELGEKANGRFADLKIVEVPDDVEWTIEEYDGNEWVAEKHRTWS